MAHMVKNLPAMWETKVQSLSWEDPLQKEWQSTPGLVPREFHGQRSLMGYSSWGCIKLDTTEQLHFHLSGYILKVMKISSYRFVS